MRPWIRQLSSGLAVLVGFVAGVALLMFFVANRQAPERQEAAVSATPVRTVAVQPLDFRLEARGHGVARPAETWQAVANVAGRVVERHPELESGTLLPKGTLLVALDPSRYELAIVEAEAELSSLDGELSQLEAEEKNTDRLLALEQQALALTEQELSRIERLAASGSVSTSRRDEQRRSAVGQRRAVASLENTLALMPARREVLQARRERAEVRLTQARKDLTDTRFEAPYDLRLSDVDIELHQFVGSGQRLFQAESLAAAEVEAHIPIGMMRRLLGAILPEKPFGQGLDDLNERLDFSAVDADLLLVGAEGVGWSGELIRVASGLDPATRTVRAVVRVDHPYRDAGPPNRPPLQRDMYIRVRLSAWSRAPRLAIPAGAVHQGEAWLVGDDQRLERRAVSVAFEQGDLAVISAGLAPGERVVVDDLSTAIAGMAVAGQRDRNLEAQIAGQALGEEHEEAQP